MITIEQLCQFVIIVAGAIAAWYSQDPNPSNRKWSSVAGLVTQPAWFYSTFVNHQWGMFLVSFIFAAAYARGFISFWIKKEQC